MFILGTISELGSRELQENPDRTWCAPNEFPGWNDGLSLHLTIHHHHCQDMTIRASGQYQGSQILQNHPFLQTTKYFMVSEKHSVASSSHEIIAHDIYEIRPTASETISGWLLQASMQEAPVKCLTKRENKQLVGKHLSVRAATMATSQCLHRISADKTCAPCWIIQRTQFAVLWWSIPYAHDRLR